MKKCEICRHTKEPEYVIHTGIYWLVMLAPDQGYLGRSYVTLREHKGHLSDLSDMEWKEFQQICKAFEYATKQAFGAEPCNWAVMMNNAYELEPANPHVHWHVRPRYKKSVLFGGTEFKDPLYGQHYDREQRFYPSEVALNKITNALKKAFHI